MVALVPPARSCAFVNKALLLNIIIYFIFKGSLHRFGYRNFCVNVYTCISVVRPLIDVNLGLN